MFIATIARRPEFAGLAAPALLLLAAGRGQRRPPRISLRVRPGARRAIEGELIALDVAAGGYGECDVTWTLHPGPEIEPAGATTAEGPQARFTFTPRRWGRRQPGRVDVVLRDRWRLAEGHLTVVLPAIDCFPAPAQQRTRVVLSRLPNRLGEHPARTYGEGIEFAGVRGYVPGDRQRSINWPASTRRGRLQVNTFAAERSQDVVVRHDYGSPRRQRRRSYVYGKARAVLYRKHRNRIRHILATDPIALVYPVFLVCLPLTLVFPLYPLLLLIPMYRNRAQNSVAVVVGHLFYGAGVLAGLAGR